ncbi:diguanylate cyclase response regulator [Chloroflexus islandicus]|uniref:Diguanylate cyclase response regulator n=1 Tax=Chloroflexus islandicus TaxID=1707952 RepID=A0A178MI40_9CHLR|nr:diguanylate cyclase [Chloroflexus islandicus]OAN48279.1 diguanylate cyclase response regulator [Chloroflexus islandicus]
MSNNRVPTILIVDDIPANLLLLTQLLDGQSYDVRPVTQGAMALAAARAIRPDLILLDIRMPDKDGYTVCRELKADPETSSIPIIFVSALDDIDGKVRAFECGGVDYVTKPFQPAEVLARVRTHLALAQARTALEMANRELQRALAREAELARIDWLTGVYNRSHFYELATHEFAIATRYDQALAICMFDVDHFKQVNDRYGHLIGDQVLRAVAQTAARQIRAADCIGRFGGEEFILLLPNTDTLAGLMLAERLRAAIADLRVSTEQGEVAVTISAGVAGRQPADTVIERLIDRADQALYAAKRQGRNCVVGV